MKERRGRSVIFTRVETDSQTGITTFWEKKLERFYWSLTRRDKCPNYGPSRIISKFYGHNCPFSAEYRFFDEKEGFSRQIELYGDTFKIQFDLGNRDFVWTGATYEAKDGSFRDITITPHGPKEGEEDFFIELTKLSEPGLFLFSAQLLEEEGTLSSEVLRVGETLEVRGFSYRLDSLDRMILVDITDLANQRVTHIEFPEQVDIVKFLQSILDVDKNNWVRALDAIPSRVSVA